MKKLLLALIFISTIWAYVPEKSYVYHAGALISTSNFQQNSNDFIKAVTNNAANLTVRSITMNYYAYQPGSYTTTYSYNIAMPSLLRNGARSAMNISNGALQINNVTGIFAPIPQPYNFMRITGMTVSADAGVTVSVCESNPADETSTVLFSTSGNATTYYTDSTISQYARHVYVTSTTASSKNIYAITIYYKIDPANSSVATYRVTPSVYDTWTDTSINPVSLNARYNRMYNILTGNAYSLHVGSITAPSLTSFKQPTVTRTVRLYPNAMNTYRKAVGEIRKWDGSSALGTTTVVDTANVIVIDHTFIPGSKLKTVQTESAVSGGGVAYFNLYAIDVVAGTRTLIVTKESETIDFAAQAINYTVTGKEFFIVEYTILPTDKIAYLTELLFTMEDSVWY